MAEEKNTDKRRNTPMTGAEQNANDRPRRPERPASEDRSTNDKLEERIRAANETANQTIDQGNENEVQGRLAVPTVKVQKRGSTKWTDPETGQLRKELNDAEPNVRIAEGEKPDYLKLHEAVLNGEDPLKATLKFQGREEESFAEGKLENAETHPRTYGLGDATAAPEAEERKSAQAEQKNAEENK